MKFTPLVKTSSQAAAPRIKTMGPLMSPQGICSASGTNPNAVAPTHKAVNASSLSLVCAVQISSQSPKMNAPSTNTSRASCPVRMSPIAAANSAPPALNHAPDDTIKMKNPIRLPITVPKAIATPPRRGTGAAWVFRSPSGASTIPVRFIQAHMIRLTAKPMAANPPATITSPGVIAPPRAWSLGPTSPGAAPSAMPRHSRPLPYWVRVISGCLLIAGVSRLFSVLSRSQDRKARSAVRLSGKGGCSGTVLGANSA